MHLSSIAPVFACLVTRLDDRLFAACFLLGLLAAGMPLLSPPLSPMCVRKRVCMRVPMHEQLEAAVTPVVAHLLADDNEVAARVSAVTDTAAHLQSILHTATAVPSGGPPRATPSSRFAPGVIHALSRERHGSERKSSFRTPLGRDLQVVDAMPAAPASPSVYLPSFLAGAVAAVGDAGAAPAGAGAGAGAGTRRWSCFGAPGRKGTGCASVCCWRAS
jgi:hypothetical protein